MNEIILETLTAARRRDREMLDYWRERLEKAEKEAANARVNIAEYEEYVAAFDKALAGEKVPA